MILFLEDWKNHPSATIHYQTRNQTFLRLAGLYKNMGIKNHAFHLALHNPELASVNPHDPYLSSEQRLMVAIECKQNPWYYFREVANVPGVGVDGAVMFRGNRGNIPVYWLFFNHITNMLIQPRQTGKSLSVDQLMTYIKNIGAVNTDMLLLTKDDALRVKNIQRMKEVEDSLPDYLNLKSRKDANNSEKLTCKRLGNTYHTFVSQSSPIAARNVGRGLTVGIFQIDEAAFCQNLDYSLPSMLAAGNAAIDSIKQHGGFYGTLFTTTAGFLSNKVGRFVYGIYKDCMPWSETLYDCENIEDLKNTIRKNSPRGRLQVLCEFNHRQLGYTDEWLREKMEAAMSEGENRAADYLNIWGQGNAESPIPKEILRKINQSIMNDYSPETIGEGFIIRWYIDRTTIQNRILVGGMDTSEATGGDDTAIVLLDATTGEVCGVGTFNNINTITLSTILADFLIKYKNITLIIERKSTGLPIIDNLILLLVAKGIDPFKRLFNLVINDAKQNKEYMDRVVNTKFQYRDESVYTDYRSKFGYATSGTGRMSRSMLYGLVFKSATTYLCNTIRDKTLISEMTSLVIKNGRIDHPVGEHDDLVIALMLAHYLLTSGNNLSFYGIDPKYIYSNIKDSILEQDDDETIEHKREQKILKNKIYELVDEMKQVSNAILKERLLYRIEHLYKDLDHSLDPSFNIEDLLQQLKHKR